MLAVAGIGLLGAKSEGAEAWGADEESLEKDLHGAALVYMRLAALAADGNFEAQFGDRFLAVAAVTTEPPDIEVRMISTGKAD